MTGYAGLFGAPAEKTTYVDGDTRYVAEYLNDTPGDTSESKWATSPFDYPTEREAFEACEKLADRHPWRSWRIVRVNRSVCFTMPSVK